MEQGWKTILVHADASAHAPGRIRFAARLARECGALLTGVATTNVSRYACPAYPDNPGLLICSYLDPLYEAAERCLDQFENLAREAGATCKRHLASDLPDDALARAAACADVAVLSQDDPAESTTMALNRLPESVLLASARPVIVVPRAGTHQRPLRRILVAWNGSNEASSALWGALPLLRRAADVAVVMFDPPAEDSPAGVHPAADLSGYLSRHGVQAGVITRHVGPDAGDAMLALCGEWRADLLVMGCYGHTRMRELLLGGATRTVLARMTLPVLMAH